MKVHLKKIGIPCTIVVITIVCVLYFFPEHETVSALKEASIKTNAHRLKSAKTIAEKRVVIEEIIQNMYFSIIKVELIINTKNLESSEIGISNISKKIFIYNDVTYIVRDVFYNYERIALHLSKELQANNLIDKKTEVFYVMMINSSNNLNNNNKEKIITMRFNGSKLNKVSYKNANQLNFLNFCSYTEITPLLVNEFKNFIKNDDKKKYKNFILTTLHENTIPEVKNTIKEYLAN